MRFLMIVGLLGLFSASQSIACSNNELIDIAEKIETSRLELQAVQAKMRRAEDRLYQCTQNTAQITVECNFRGLSSGKFTSQATAHNYAEAKRIALDRATRACMKKVSDPAFCATAKRFELHKSNSPLGIYHYCIQVN